MRYFFLLSLPLYVVDQITKWLIVANFPDHYDQPVEPRVIDVIPGFFNLVRVHNTGMAWGTFNGSRYANLAFGAIAISALIAITMIWRRGGFPNKIGKTAAALLVSGILGNFTDRMVHGYVVDFLDFYIGASHWPSFNVADSCICVAAGLLFIGAFRQEKPASSDT